MVFRFSPPFFSQSGVPLASDVVEQVVALCALGDGTADYHQLLAMLGQQ